jgi:hypothetical protein
VADLLLAGFVGRRLAALGQTLVGLAKLVGHAANRTTVSRSATASEVINLNRLRVVSHCAEPVGVARFGT